MLRMFIPTSNGKISRRRYIFSFILINFIFAFLIIFLTMEKAGFSCYSLYHLTPLSRHQSELPTTPVIVVSSI